MSTLSKKSPVWHTQVAAELNKDFVEINALEMSAAKRRAYLGLKFIWVKESGKADGSIPHGQFEGWMQEHCPQIPDRSRRRFMGEAESICERMGWQIGQIGRFEIPPHKMIELSVEDVPKKDQKAQQLLLDLVEDRGRFQRVTAYKQLDESGKAKIGRVKGSGGATREQRALAQIEDLEERKKMLRAKATEIANWLMFHADAEGLLLVAGTEECDALLKAMKYTTGVFKHQL